MTGIMLAGLFRRGRPKLSRADAFDRVFDVSSGIFEAASRIKPDWLTQWDSRTTDGLPPRYDFDNDSARAAARDMRQAMALLQRNRWKSVVEPLFDESHVEPWTAFRSAALDAPHRLLAVRETFEQLLLEDELDWIESAIEQFDELRRSHLTDDAMRPSATRMAESTFACIYHAIRLSDRFIERLRFEASQQR